MKNETKKIKHYTKWCAECGRAVDLRRKGSYKLSPEFAPKNSEYHYICSDKCKLSYHSHTMIGSVLLFNIF